MACDENKITCILETIKLSIREKHQIAASGCSYVQTEYAVTVIFFITSVDLIFIYRYKRNELYTNMHVCMYAPAKIFLKFLFLAREKPQESLTTENLVHLETYQTG